MADSPTHDMLHKITNSGQNKKMNNNDVVPKVNDVTITFERNAVATVTGVNGKDPADGTNGIWQSGNGSNVVKIGGFDDIDPGKDLELKIHNQAKDPVKIKTVTWSFNNENLRHEQPEIETPKFAMLEFPSSEEPTEVAMKIDDLNFKMDNVIAWMNHRRNFV